MKSKEIIADALWWGTLSILLVISSLLLIKKVDYNLAFVFIFCVGMIFVILLKLLLEAIKNLEKKNKKEVKK